MDRSDLVGTDQTVSAAIAGDEPAFAALTERHLAGRRDRLGPRHQRGRGQQRPAAGPGDDAVAPARPARRVVRAFKLDVMRIEAGVISEITTFNAELFPAFGLEPTL